MVSNSFSGKNVISWGLEQDILLGASLKQKTGTFETRGLAYLLICLSLINREHSSPEFLIGYQLFSFSPEPVKINKAPPPTSGEKRKENQKKKKGQKK